MWFLCCFVCFISCLFSFFLFSFFWGVGMVVLGGFFGGVLGFFQVFLISFFDRCSIDLLYDLQISMIQIRRTSRVLFFCDVTMLATKQHSLHYATERIDIPQLLLHQLWSSGWQKITNLTVLNFSKFTNFLTDSINKNLSECANRF